MAIWASVYEAEMGVQKFPLNTQIGTFEDEEDIIKWMLKQEDSQVLAIDYFAFIKHSPLIFTPLVNEYIMRYNLLKTFNINSYGNVLDELPALWVDALNVMESEYNKAVSCKNKR